MKYKILLIVKNSERPLAYYLPRINLIDFESKSTSNMMMSYQWFFIYCLKFHLLLPFIFDPLDINRPIN